LLFLSAIPALSLEHAVRQLEVIGGLEIFEVFPNLSFQFVHSHNL
jgi:hypothetical protein